MTGFKKIQLARASTKPRVKVGNKNTIRKTKKTGNKIKTKIF